MTQAKDMLLLVDPVHDQAWPVSAEAFDLLRGPKSQVMARNCTALFLGPEGNVRILSDIAPERADVLTRAGLWAGRPVKAKYLFEEMEMPTEDMRVMINDAATYMRDRPQRRAWWLTQAPLGEIQSRIGAATTLAEIYGAIDLPRTERWGLL
jgi:hypothetical protein